MPYGLRMLRAWIVGLALAALWLLVVWPGFDGGTQLQLLGAHFRPLVLMMAVGLVLALLCTPARVLFPLVPRSGWKSWHVVPIAVLVVVGYVAYWSGTGHAQAAWKLWSSYNRQIDQYLDSAAFYKQTEQEALRKGDPSTAMSFAEFAENEVRHADDIKRGLRTFRMAFVWVLSAGLLALLPPMLVRWKERLIEHDTLRRWILAGRGGSARWAGPAKLDRLAFDPFGLWRTLCGRGGACDGVYLGVSLFDDDFCGRHIVVRDDAHMLTIGQTGSGKSVTSIWPTLAMYSGSAIVIDPKGEHAMMCGPYRGGGGPSTWKRMPHAVAHYLDPFGRCAKLAPSARYNLLAEIDIEGKDARKLISAITASCIVPMGGENKFWEDTSRLVLDGAIAHVLSTFPPERRTLPAVADLLIGLDPATGFADPDRLKETMIDMRMNGAAGGLPQKAAATLDRLGEKAYGNVTAELEIALKWATDPAMREILSASDFSFRDLGDPSRPTTVFIALPFGDMVEQSRWLRAVTNLSMRLLESRESRAVPPVLYVLDELPQYGRQLHAIKDGMTTMRSAGVKIWAFVQHWKMLIECFGEEGARNFESSGTVQVYGVNDNETAQWISEKLGKRIVKDYKGILRRREVGQREVNLADAAYVATQLGKTTPLQYVFPCDGPPMRLKRRAFRTVRIEGQRFKGLPLTGHFGA